MQSFNQFLTEDATKNLHLEHLEDLVFLYGIDGVRSGINFIQSIRDMLSGTTNKKVDLHVKWDGAPAVFAGTDPADGKFFVGYCNRVACKWQVPEDCSPGDSYREHRDFALKQHWDELAPYQVKGLKKRSVIDRTGRAMLSGFFMVIRKDHWEDMKGFIQTRRGCLGLDNELHKITQDLGVKVWQLPIYLYHWYRGATNDKTHLL